MNGRPARPGVHLFASAASVLGPASALLYEAGHLRLFPGDPLRDVWVLVLLSVIGAAVGLVCFVRGAKAVGALCIVTNLVVVALYGFIAMFFQLGGSR